MEDIVLMQVPGRGKECRQHVVLQSQTGGLFLLLLISIEVTFENENQWPTLFLFLSPDVSNLCDLTYVTTWSKHGSQCDKTGRSNQIKA